MSLALIAAVLAAFVSGIVSAAPGGPPPEALFQTSDRCIGCHNNLITPRGKDISIGYDWRSSMMANAARDPYWQASVRREVLEHPNDRDAIEDECSVCHMAMSSLMHKTTGDTGRMFAHLPAGRAATPYAAYAADGVSCSVCHQIEDTGLGTRASFTGGFVIDTTRPAGQRQGFGSFEVDAGRQRIMRSATGFNPVKATHIKQSELCATCHTLFTRARDDQGNQVGELPEQVPYLEWLHSSYRDSRSCQSCHMPAVKEPTPITNVLAQPREAVSTHVFRGGNFFMPRLFNRFRLDLGVVALPQELEATARRTADHLRTEAARLTIDRATIAQGVVDIEVEARNLAGHKLPTAYPSRRAWIHLTVRDKGGALLFESGRLTARGQIVGNDNDASASRYEPHHTVIRRSHQVQIYETIMVDASDQVTTGLLSGVRYIKDNRVLPLGFDKTTAKPEVAVRGAAAEDATFTSATDRVRYQVSLRGAEGPIRIRAELWYQPIGFRWAENLAGLNTAETNRFVAAYRSLSDASAMMLASDEQQVIPAASKR